MSSVPNSPLTVRILAGLNTGTTFSLAPVGGLSYIMEDNTLRKSWNGEMAHV